MKYIGRTGIPAYLAQHTDKFAIPGQTGMSVLLRALDVAAFRGIDANAVAFIHKRWHGDGHAIFERGRLVYVRNGGALHGGIGARDG